MLVAVQHLALNPVQRVMSMEVPKILIFAVVAVVGHSSGGEVPMKWCVEGPEAFKKCTEIANATHNHRMLTCVLGENDRDCYEKISEGLADVAAFDGGSVYHAGKEFGLQVIMSEKLRRLATSGTKYFGIAVVKKSSKLTYNKLRGAKSCHTGLWRTAGWVIPVGSLLSSGQMPCLDGDLTKSVAAFFNGSCAAGAANKKYNPKLSGADELCAICGGEGDAKCTRTIKEPYYGYEGAFRCMKDGAGDVAFIKESILMKLSKKEQAKYKLLCPDNTVKDPKDFMQCNLAGSPAHAILTRSKATPREIFRYQHLFKLVTRRYGARAKSSGKTTVFDGYLFSRYAVGLDKVRSSRRSFIDYLGVPYINAITKLEHCS